MIRLESEIMPESTLRQRIGNAVTRGGAHINFRRPSEYVFTRIGESYELLSESREFGNIAVIGSREEPPRLSEFEYHSRVTGQEDLRPIRWM